LRQGEPNKIIAHELGVSESTVKVHLRSIMSKLKVSNRTQIVCTLAQPTTRAGEAHAAQLLTSHPAQAVWSIHTANAPEA